ncbi:monocarboxylate transporter 12-like [Pecten maximus]|uniref:monocarboxylate transporter 12-like n=1 Tax=Pecten maximus TaxID=6579 RepID=UPI001457E72F|nr:monocarboxylate transporter 12-like [Pecten maximus]
MENKDQYDDVNTDDGSVKKQSNLESSLSRRNEAEQSQLIKYYAHNSRDSAIEQKKLVNNGTTSSTRDESDTDMAEVTSEVICTGGKHDDEGGDDDITEDTMVEEDINRAPDGGYGWVIVLGSMLAHLIIGGLERSSGVLYLKLDEKFQQSAVATAWVLSLSSGLRLILGPVCSALCNRYSHRSVVISGTVLVFISMIATSLSPDLTFTYFSYGFLGGVGRLFAYAPAVIIVGEYFNKKRGIAVGLATSGVGFGSFLFPTMIEMFFKVYGYFGSFLLLAGVMLNLAVSGCLFRPLWLHTQMAAHQERGRQLKDTELGTELLEQKSNTNKPKQAEKRLSVSSRKSKSKTKKFLDLSLLKDFRFLCFCVAILLFTVSSQIAFVFIPPYAKSKGISDLHASYAVSIAGISDGIGRILSGIILDLKRVKKYRVYVYNIVMFFIGLTSFIIPNIDTFGPLSAVCGVYGLLVGTYISQKSVVIVDILGVKHLVSSFGLLICFQGIGMFIGPPIAGVMKDVSGHYEGGFYLGGSSIICGGLVLTAGNAYHYFRQSKPDL